MTWFLDFVRSRSRETDSFGCFEIWQRCCRTPVKCHNDHNKRNVLTTNSMVRDFTKYSDKTSYVILKRSFSARGAKVCGYFTNLYRFVIFPVFCCCCCCCIKACLGRVWGSFVTNDDLQWTMKMKIFYNRKDEENYKDYPNYFQKEIHHRSIAQGKW